MRTVSRDRTFIDYFQNIYLLQEGVTNRFGIRVGAGCCMAVLKVAGGKPLTFGKEYPLPVDLQNLPGQLQIMIDDYLLYHPDSELTSVLAGRKSFQEALDSPSEREPAVLVRGAS